MSANLVHNPAPEGTYCPAVTTISHAELLEALHPLLAALGTTPGAVLTGSLSFSSDRVRFVTCEPMKGITPIRWGSDDEASIWAWPVEIEVELP